MSNGVQKTYQVLSSFDIVVQARSAALDARRPTVLSRPPGWQGKGAGMQPTMGHCKKETLKTLEKNKRR